MSDKIKLWLPQAKSTELAGFSLARNLYSYPLDLYLTGELGAGKTHFLKSFAKNLGISDLVSSPTYALEQRYKTEKGLDFVHIDLYRLEARHLPEILSQSEHHTGIRAIEWADRIPEGKRGGHGYITLDFEEKDNGRSLAITFHDAALPTRKQIEEWRKDVMLPEHIARHCDAVAAFAVKLADALIERSIIVRKEALERSAEVHDLFRFIDFRPGAGPTDVTHTPEQEKVWQSYKDRFPAMKHEPACAAFLRGHGYPELAEIVAVHGLTLPTPDRSTTEQKLLFYADKRMMVDQTVTLDERFEDFRKRYPNSPESQRSKIWYEEAKNVENDLFPDGVPF